ncbi:MAG TPA: type 1 glutamine amidotransferase [Chroococcidiopsis sp.]
MKFLVLKHAVIEGAGIFELFCREAAIAFDSVDLSQGESFPEIADYDALLVMGGAMNVGDEAQFSWLIEEKAFIRQAIALGKPYLGTCLGAQLLADALGGTVGWMKSPEVGVLPVTLTAAGQAHPLMQGMPAQFHAVQWHGQEVQTMPPGATVLAASPHCPVQAYAVGGSAFGLQFHSEVDDNTLAAWLSVPDYCADLETVLGVTACADMTQAVARHLTGLTHRARVLFHNFVGLVGDRSAYRPD